MLRRVCHGLVLFLLVLLLLEGTVRLYQRWYSGAPLAGPMILHYYPGLAPLLEHPVQRRPGQWQVLLLGGSVLNNCCGHIQSFLSAALARAAGGRRVQVHNLGEPGLTSRDSLIRYRLLGDSRFDLVIFYHGINETRANNCPEEMFRSDYTHFSWYADIQAVENHPESRWLRLPVTLEIVWRHLLIRLGLRKVLPMGRQEGRWLELGCRVKTTSAFARNLTELVRLARRRGDRLLLVTFALYIPPDYSLAAFRAHGLDYGRHQSPVELWGRPRCVRRGVEAHNRVLRRLSRELGVPLVDLARRMPRGRRYFDDPCHLTLQGSRRWVELVLPRALARLERGTRRARALPVVAPAGL